MNALTLGPDAKGRTVHIADGLVVAEPPAGAESLACPDGEIAPGDVCAHTHIYSGLAPFNMPKPAVPPKTFVEILEKVWWRLDRALDAESLRASARYYIAQSLLFGTTSLVDHHESPAFIEGSLAILAQAAEELGIRALLAYGATERNGGRDEAQRGLTECTRVPTSPLVRGLVGLHASFTVSDETIGEAGNLARNLGTALHVHVAEAKSDVEDAQARGYAGPLERLIALDALPPGSILAHGVHLSPEQVGEAEKRGCWLVQNPRSNEGNGVGYAGSLAAIDRVALGVDGWNADMAEEEQALFRLAETNGDTKADGRRDAGRQLVAETFGFSATGFTPGAAGDFVVRENGRVSHVVVGGKVVVRNGQLAGLSFETIKADAEEQSKRLWARMDALPD